MMENVKQIEVESYIYEKVKKPDNIINIPTEPFFFQESSTTCIGIFPQRADWEEGMPIWKLVIVEVTDTRIYRTSIGTHPDLLSDIISNLHITSGMSEADLLRGGIVRYLMDYYGDDQISRETFMNHLFQLTGKLSEEMEEDIIQVETRERQLENALKVAMAALGTYGTHPIIQSQARKALKKKDGSENVYTEDEVVELFHKLEEARSSYAPEDAGDILPLEQFLEEENIKG